MHSQSHNSNFSPQASIATGLPYGITNAVTAVPNASFAFSSADANTSWELGHKEASVSPKQESKPNWHLSRCMSVAR